MAWVILTYHQIKESNGEYSVSSTVFEEHMHYLYDNNIRSATMGEVLTAIESQKACQMVDKRRLPRVALLIAAHNEELVLADTINSAIKAGLKPEYIYVVDDNSSDDTSNIARSILPHENVYKVERSGKGLAIKKAAERFDLSSKYRWIHIADADGKFPENYFAVLRSKLRVKNAAATGYVRSLKGKYVSQYRVFEYTVGMEIHRRVQSMFNVIPIIPGPTSCFRADVFAQLDFSSGSLTEDFDVTMQIYRKKLGRIQFIRNAVALTQDPLTVRSFINQISRWNRGVLQVMRFKKCIEVCAQ